MDGKIIISCKKDPSVQLRSIGAEDLESLRIWKNANSDSFFHTKEISPQQQLQWFKAYLEKPQDYMFIVLANNEKIGCMGFRKLDNENQTDIYNIILGKEEYGKKGYMTVALNTMCNFSHKVLGLDITVKVLKTNPAANWYRKNNFIDISLQNDYFYLKLNNEYFGDYSFDKTSE